MTTEEKDRRIRTIKLLTKLTLFTLILDSCMAIATCLLLMWMNIWWHGQILSIPASYRVGVPAQLFNMPWLSLMLGIVIGLPENIWHRYHAAGKREATIEKLLGPHKVKLTWQAYLSSLVECLPFLASHILAIVIVYSLGLSIFPAIFSVGIAGWLRYPEIKENSEEAIRRLATQPESVFSEITPFSS